MSEMEEVVRAEVDREKHKNYLSNERENLEQSSQDYKHDYPALPFNDDISCCTQSTSSSSLSPLSSQDVAKAEKETLHRLKLECDKLVIAMKSQTRYSEEWFSLKSRLEFAQQELDATLQDRDLFFDELMTVTPSASYEEYVSNTNTLSYDCLSPCEIIEAVEKLQFLTKQLDEVPKYSWLWFQMKADINSIKTQLALNNEMKSSISATSKISPKFKEQVASRVDTKSNIFVAVTNSAQKLYQMDFPQIQVDKKELLGNATLSTVYCQSPGDNDNKSKGRKKHYWEKNNYTEKEKQNSAGSTFTKNRNSPLKSLKNLFGECLFRKRIRRDMVAQECH